VCWCTRFFKLKALREAKNPKKSKKMKLKKENERKKTERKYVMREASEVRQAKSSSLGPTQAGRTAGWATPSFPWQASLPR
jgi:hypothetical protein